MDKVPLILKNPPKTPDLVRNKDLVKDLFKRYLSSFKLRTRISQGIAVLGAKTPFAHAMLVGGVSTVIRADDIGFLYSLLRDIERFLRQYEKDILLLANNFKNLFEIGKGPGNYLSVSHLYTPGKVLINGKVEYLNVDNITKYNPRYGFIKVPRYKERVIEVSPLAECIIKRERKFFNILKKLNISYKKANSVMGRLIARYVDSYLAYKHANKLLENISTKKNNIYWKEPDDSYEGKGYGFVKSARGAIFHYVNIKESKIKRYLIISPSMWNFSPGGATEIALRNCPVESKDLVNIGRVIRSFDPCIACAVL